MFRGISQIGNHPEVRQREWDISSNAEREEYTSAMEQWKEDFPFAASVMSDCIGDPKIKQL